MVKTSAQNYFSKKLSLWLNIFMLETILEGPVPANILVTCFLVHSLQLQIPEVMGM
jgi:hypothetical protein